MTRDQILAIVFVLCALAAFGGLPFFAHLIATAYHAEDHHEDDVEKPDPNPEVPRWLL